jgi:hypothetical protein
MSTVEEITRAVEQLPPEDLVRFLAWVDERRSEGLSLRPSDTAWFQTYMACPHAFEIPPRKKQFYQP